MLPPGYSGGIYILSGYPVYDINNIFILYLFYINKYYLINYYVQEMY